MTQRIHTPTYTAEYRERGIRLFKENRSNYPSNDAAYKAIASKLGFSPDSLRAWCQQAERDAGLRDGLSSEEMARLKALEREVRELRQVNEILKKASGPVTFSCRSNCSFKRPFFRRPRGFSIRGLSVCDADCRSH